MLAQTILRTSPVTRLLRICWFGLAAQMVVSASVAAQSAEQQPRLMEREREIALALSACPPPVARKAAVYVLEKSGYVQVREGENGFTAMVAHRPVRSPSVWTRRARARICRG
jgi:hypothetical protein